MVTTYVFPGQGSQYVGMGTEIAQHYPEAKTLYDRASAVLGFDLLAMCQATPPELLASTENAQPAILVTSLACWQVAQPQLPKPTFMAGLSLGEYSALVAAGALEFEDAVFLVRKRGLFMKEALANRQTKMVALIGLNAEQVEAICHQVTAEGVCQAANYNAPAQIVIGGDAVAIDRAIPLAEKSGATRVVVLKVSAAFHTHLMEPATAPLAKLLAAIKIQDPEIPIVSNVTGKPVDKAVEIRSLLVRQLTSPVRWSASLEFLAQQNTNTFVEFGPGKTLSNLIQLNVKQAKTLNVENCASINKTFTEMGKATYN